MTRDAASVLLPGFVGTTLPDWVARRLRDGLAGVCLFGGNISSRAQLRELTDSIRAANPLAVIAVDEEGGDVTRLYYDSGSPYPGAAILGRIDDLDYTERVGCAVGEDLARAGVTLDLAPDADVNSDADNPVIGVRSFGSESEHVGRHTAAWTRGLQSAGVAACAKHFPGHGDTAMDSHHSLPVVDLDLDELRRRELIPFQAAISAGTQTIMTSHILLPRVDPVGPATFSAAILQDLLRGELGFDGVIVSDALDMAGASAETGIPEAAVRALTAGCDLLCIGTDNTDGQLEQIEAAIDTAVQEGRLHSARVADAGARVRRLAEWSLAAGASGPWASPPVAQPVPHFDLAPTAASFDIAAGVARAGQGALVWPVLLDTTANMAVGSVPWGPFTSLNGGEGDGDSDSDDADGGAGWRAAQSLEEGDPLDPPPPGARLWLIGRDNHRHGWVRALIDDARERFPDVVVVDMGWPSDDRAYADIATFGASAHAGAALRSLEVAR